MKSPGHKTALTQSGTADAGPSGLSPQHKAALNQATEMIAGGQSQDAAVAHLVAHEMPRVVAKVLVKQLDKRS